jgi:hypothetical protein
MATKRRILREFRIAEISAVDRPAQEGALMAIMKRADDEQEDDEMELRKIASFDSFEAAVAAIAKREGCQRHVAFSKAANAFPALLDAYRREGSERVAKAADDLARRRAKPAAATHFDRIVDGIMDRDKVSRSAAMSKARQENPDAYRAMQAA